jgi:hypothetical protein
LFKVVTLTEDAQYRMSDVAAATGFDSVPVLQCWLNGVPFVELLHEP